MAKSNTGSDHLEPQIVTLETPIHFVGLLTHTTDRKIYREVARLGKRYNRIKTINPISNLKEPWAFVAVTKNYQPETGQMDYMLGDVVTELERIPEGLSGFIIPAGIYAVFPIRPRFKFFWGPAMGRTKNHIYTQWLPKSDFVLAGGIDDFEYHDAKSVGKRPEISLYVAVKHRR